MQPQHFSSITRNLPLPFPEPTIYHFLARQYVISTSEMMSCRLDVKGELERALGRARGHRVGEPSWGRSGSLQFATLRGHTFPSQCPQFTFTAAFDSIQVSSRPFSRRIHCTPRPSAAPPLPFSSLPDHTSFPTRHILCQHPLRYKDSITTTTTYRAQALSHTTPDSNTTRETTGPRYACLAHQVSHLQHAGPQPVCTHQPGNQSQVRYAPTFSSLAPSCGPQLSHRFHRRLLKRQASQVLSFSNISQSNLTLFGFLTVAVSTATLPPLPRPTLSCSAQLPPPYSLAALALQLHTSIYSAPT